MTDADLLHALRDCYEPRLRRDVVSLGLVQSATVQPDPDAPGANVQGVPPRFAATVVLRAPGTDDAANAILVALIANRLAGLPAISHTDIRLLPTLFPVLPS